MILDIFERQITKHEKVWLSARAEIQTFGLRMFTVWHWPLDPFISQNITKIFCQYELGIYALSIWDTYFHIDLNQFAHLTLNMNE